MARYHVFERTWWKRAPKGSNWPDGRMPGPGRKHTIGYADSEEAARDMCRVWSANNAPGKYSRKAEYERA